MTDPVTICITSHDAYLANLPLVISAWDTFAPKEWRRIISLDGCDFNDPRFKNWEVLKNPKTGFVSDSRNQALTSVDRGWVLFWDADNIPTKEYVDAIAHVSQFETDVACWYPDMNLLPYDPVDIRLANYIDSASLWRAEALRTLGGWPRHRCLQDWALNIQALAHGFKSLPLNASFVYVKHKDSITGSYDPSENILPLRPIGVICPLRGDKTLTSEWLNALKRMDYPAQVGVTIIDKSGSEHFGTWLKGQLSSLPFYRVTYLKDDEVKTQTFGDIHNSVGKSYALAVPMTPEPLILTWEDDVIPLQTDSVRELVKNIYPLSPYHVVGAHVPTRENPNLLIATHGREKWEGHIPASIGGLTHIGMLGGGFTLWHRAVLEEFGFQGMHFIGDFPLGWDGWLCRRINTKYKIGLAPVKCLHER